MMPSAAQGARPKTMKNSLKPTETQFKDGADDYDFTNGATGRGERRTTVQTLKTFGQGVKLDVQKAGKYIKRQLTPKSRRNKVKEISIKPSREECWVEDSTLPRYDSSCSMETDSRTGSASSTQSKVNDDIPVIFDAEYNGL